MTLRDWMPSAMVDAQCAHACAGLAVAGWCFAWAWPWWSPLPLTGGWIVIKEWGVDLCLEKDSAWDSGIDSLWYALGTAAGMGLRWLTS